MPANDEYNDPDIVAYTSIKTDINEKYSANYSSSLTY